MVRKKDTAYKTTARHTCGRGGGYTMVTSLVRAILGDPIGSFWLFIPSAISSNYAGIIVCTVCSQNRVSLSNNLYASEMLNQHAWNNPSLESTHNYVHPTQIRCCLISRFLGGFPLKC